MERSAGITKIASIVMTVVGEGLLLLAVRVWRPYGGRVLLRAVLLCLGYALLDEIHQHFVPGRAFQLADLGLDLLGSTLGAWLGLRLFR